MGFSLARSGNRQYQRGYLRSAAWFRRRDRWFAKVEDRGLVAVCQVCGAPGSLDLHHVSYDGVRRDDETGTWRAGEKHEDLMPLCREHHQAVHDEFDRRRRDFWGWDRRRATAVVVVGLRKRRRT